MVWFSAVEAIPSCKLQWDRPKPYLTKNLDTLYAMYLGKSGGTRQAEYIVPL